MPTWSDNDLGRIGDATELQLASAGDDGGLSLYTTMWVVRVGKELYVRSAGGPDRLWYRRAQAGGGGRIRAGGVERDVVFGEADPGSHRDIDAAYHAKYDAYGPTTVGHVIGQGARHVTIRLQPRTNDD